MSRYFGGKNFRQWITFDRALLVAVLVIQAGMAGWLYLDYTAQQQRTPTHKPTIVQSPSPRPATLSPQPDPSHFLPLGSDPVGQHTAGAPIWAPLAPLLDPDFVEPPDPVKMMAEMQARVDQSYRAFRQMHRALMNDDMWRDVSLTPTMDMRDYPDRYEVVMSLPGVQPDNVETKLDGRNLSVSVSQSDDKNRQSRRHVFQSRILLPWSVKPDAIPQTRCEADALIVCIPK